jgi:hypothetical protein
VTEQVHREKDLILEEEWDIVRAMISLVISPSNQSGEEGMEGDSAVVPAMVGEEVSDSGVAMEIITMVMSQMYLKRLYLKTKSGFSKTSCPHLKTGSQKPRRNK